VLATLIAAYEEKHYPFDPPHPIEAIKFRREQQGLTRKDLETMIHHHDQTAEHDTWNSSRSADPAVAEAQRRVKCPSME
jgi:hypothetical protein